MKNPYAAQPVPKNITDKNAAPKLKNSYCLKLLFRFMRPELPFIILALVFSAAHTVAVLAVPVFLGRAINLIAGAQNVDFDGVFRNSVYIMACAAGAFITQWLTTLMTNRASLRTVCSLRIAAFNKLNRVPLSYIDSSSHGDVMSRIVNDTEAVSDGLISGFTNVFSGLITIIGTIGFMFALNVKIALIVVLVTPLSVVVSYFIARLSRDKFRRQSIKRGELSGLVEEMLSNQKVVKAFSYEGAAEKRFEEINTDLKKAGVSAMFTSSLSNPASRVVNSIVYALVALFGALAVLSNPVAFSVGALTSFLAYANQYTKPFNEVTGVLTELQSSLASLRRVAEVLEEKEESSDAGLKDLSECDGTLKAESVYFSYDKAKPLITDFNIDIKKGMRVAIVGPTGCGKTTLINLLMRFYDPDSGRILISNRDTVEIPRSSLRAHYGMILQDSWLFKGTIRENIAYGKENATDEEIIEAAKKAHIHGFIMRQEKGYDSPVSEDGANISQGQKQLITIARIMLTTPPMLILDEATSNIDTRTEKLIQQAFKTMMNGRTSFIIAHRLSTIQDADLILVMNKGNVIESGTHNELLDNGGFYSALFNSQFSQY